MFDSLNNILEGWANNIKNNFGLLSPELKSKGEKRLLICNNCPLRNNNTCSTSRTGEAVTTFLYRNEKTPRQKGVLYKGCGCNISAKTVCDNCQCPLGKWENIK